MNICLKFIDEAQAKSVLYVDAIPNFLNIDTIGQISKMTGETDASGYPVMTMLDGWHVNVFLLPEEDITTLEPFIVTPLTPSRVWA